MNSDKEKNLIGGSTALMHASMDDLKVLVCLMEDPDRTEEELAALAGCSVSRVGGSVSYWKEAGIVTEAGKPRVEKTIRLASGEELARLIDSYQCQYLMDGCQDILGHTLNETEMGILIWLIRDASLDSGYILTLLKHCAEKGKGSIRYMQKIAIDYCNKGITTLAGLNTYLVQKAEEERLANFVRRTFGIGSRAFTTKEKEAINRLALYGYGEDIISLAFDINVMQTNNAKILYAAKIWENWYMKGCRTLEDCQKYQEENKKERQGNATKKTQMKESDNHSFVTTDFFKKALERSYGKTEGDKNDTQ